MYIVKVSDSLVPADVQMVYCGSSGDGFSLLKTRARLHLFCIPLTDHGPSLPPQAPLLTLLIPTAPWILAQLRAIRQLLRLLPPDPQKLLKQSRIPATGAIHGGDDVSKHGHEPDATRDEEMEEHAADEPGWELCLRCLAHDEVVVEGDDDDVADDGDYAEEKAPAEAEAADGEGFVEVVCAFLDGVEDFGVAG